MKVPSGIKSSRFWRLKAAENGTRKASKQWQEYSSDKLVTNMLFQQNDINPCIDKRFCDDLVLEQHGDDFLVCDATRDLEKLAEEFKGHILVKKSEIVSLKSEHQSEIHYSNVSSLWMNLVDMLSWIQGTEKLNAREHREFRSGAGICQYMTEQPFDSAASSYKASAGVWESIFF